MISARKLPPLAALRAFEAAARHLSFRRAADELAVTPTAISHQVRLLEETLGLALFERHTRRVSLTASGDALFPALQIGFDAFAEAIAGLYPQSKRRAVTLSATTLFTACRLIPRIGAFRERFPEFELRLHAAETVVDLHGGVADAAVRYGRAPFPRLISHHLCDELFGVVCSPRMSLNVPEDLKSVTLLHAEWYKQSDRTPNWRRWKQEARADWLDIERGPHFTDESHAIQAAIAGQGVAVASLILLRDELASGVLAQPFGPLIAGDEYHFVATPENMVCDDVIALKDWLTADFSSH